MTRFLIALFYTLVLCGSDSITPYLGSEDNALVLVDDLVNAQSGKLIQIDKDIQIIGSDPCEVIRYYDNGHHFESEFGYGIGISIPSLLVLSPSVNEKNLLIQQRTGAGIRFNAQVVKNKKTKEINFTAKIDPEIFNWGYTNCCQAVLRGEPSDHATRVQGNEKECLVTLANGTKRYYQYFKKEEGLLYYRMTVEEKPNGLYRHFSYLLPD